MVTRIVMPKLSLTSKQGTVGKWYKNEGETVEKGEPILEVISEKATYDLEAPSSGVLRRILVKEGIDVPVDTLLGIITLPSEAFSESDLTGTGMEQAHLEVEGRTLASPAAKRLARERGVDLSLVRGSGPNGRIGEEDVGAFLAGTTGQAETPKIKSVIPLSGFRKTTAERLSASFRSAPHSTVVMEVNASRIKELHERQRVSYTALIVRAAAQALAESPLINSRLEGEQIKIFEDINVGLAVATDNGLVVPVIRNADKKKLAEIDSEIAQLTEKSKQGQLHREDMTGGTFTVTNLGMYDVDFFTPIINPPETAILGVGRIVEKPIVIDGKIEACPVMMLSLSYDHRVMDGAPASVFLRKVKEKLERDAGSEG